MRIKRLIGTGYVSLISLLALVLPVAPALVPVSAQAEGREIRLLIFGDSLSAGYGLAPGVGFVGQLESALRAEGQTEGPAEGRRVTLINAGVSGDTTTGGLARLDWSLADRPDAVILELGANDALRGIDPALTRANLDALLGRLKHAGLPVLFAGMYAPPNFGPDYGRAFRALFDDLALRHDVIFYPFFLEGVAGEPSLNQPDGLHPNAEGVAVLVANILPSVRALLDRVGP